MDTGIAASPPLLVGVDWGTSAMRAILCRADAPAEGGPEVLAGPGVGRTRKVRREWVRFEGGRIVTFMTALSGELYPISAAAQHPASRY